MRYPSHLLKVIDVLKRLPGVGIKSAERYAFQLLAWSPKQLEELADVVRQIPTKLTHCSVCGCLTEELNCIFCTSSRTQSRHLCVIASAKDVFAIEATREYHGLYHVLGGVLSPMEGFNADKLSIDKLLKRIKEHQILEVVIALDSTLEGDATSLYLKKELEPLGANITRLAFGLPMGSSLDYVDGGTLARALSGRIKYE